MEEFSYNLIFISTHEIKSIYTQRLTEREREWDCEK